MADAYQATLTASIASKIRRVSSLGDLSAELSGVPDQILSTGVSTHQFNLAYWNELQLAASGNVTLDLYGSLKDPLGGTLNFAKLVAIYIRAHNDNASTIVVGASGAGGFVGPFGAATHSIKLSNNECFFVTNVNAGWPVADNTGDKLKIANNASSTKAKASVVLLGRDA